MKFVNGELQLLPLVQWLWWVRSRQEYKLPRTAVRQVIEPEQVRWVPSDYFRLPQHRGMLTIIRLGLRFLICWFKNPVTNTNLAGELFGNITFQFSKTETGLCPIRVYIESKICFICSVRRSNSRSTSWLCCLKL